MVTVTVGGQLNGHNICGQTNILHVWPTLSELLEAESILQSEFECIGYPVHTLSPTDYSC